MRRGVERSNSNDRAGTYVRMLPRDGEHDAIIADEFEVSDVAPMALTL